jgi:predicted metal-dependent enzyme (double-stranded beta helix superfamily)
MAQDVMEVIRPDELVWKEHPVFKGAQTVILVGDPTKAETIVQRVKFPPNFKVPPHTHPYSEVVTVLRGCLKSPDSVIFHRLCFPIPVSKQLGEP